MREPQREESTRHIMPGLNGIDRLAREPTAGRQGLLTQACRLPPLSDTIVESSLTHTSAHEQFLQEELYRIAGFMSNVTDACTSHAVPYACRRGKEKGSTQA